MNSPSNPSNQLQSQTSMRNLLTEGLNDDKWGYGIRRIRVMAPSYQRNNMCPYTFTSMGFKNRDGELFVCLRMNVDQHSPLKKKSLLPTSDIQKLWGDMMKELVANYVRRHKQA